MSVCSANTDASETTCSNSEDGMCLLESKIEETTALILQIRTCFKDVEGVNKLCNKVNAEFKFLTNLRSKRVDELKRYLDTSNLSHFKGIIVCACEYGNCTAFCKSFTEPNQKKGLKLEVDLVLNNGEKWVKVISRNAKGLAMEYVANSGNGNRSIVEQARCYKTMAVNYPYFYKPPKVIFQFLSGVPNLIAQRIRTLGITVLGEEVPFEELVVLPEDSDSDASTSDSNSSSEIYMVEKEEEDNEKLQAALRGEGCQILNLDITAVFALISALTHNNGANFRFTSPMLNDQADHERSNPVLPGLLELIEGKKVIICRTAYDVVQNILNTVAGPEEKKRAEKLFRSVEVVEDRLSKCAADLKLSDKINKRSKIIFGSGDYYKAVTITANRHFVNAAAYQGLRLAVFLHHPRALSEQKQMTAEPL